MANTEGVVNGQGLNRRRLRPGAMDLRLEPADPAPRETVLKSRTRLAWRVGWPKWRRRPARSGTPGRVRSCLWMQIRSRMHTGSAN